VCLVDGILKSAEEASQEVRSQSSRASETDLGCLAFLGGLEFPRVEESSH
jgi:hypothetical protein